MAVRDHLHHVRKMRAIVTTVDPEKREIHVRGADGGDRQLAVFDVPVYWVWPRVGETWSIYEENGYWILGHRFLDQDEDAALRSLNEGDPWTDIINNVAYTTYTPTWSGGVLTLGTGGTNSASWIRLGRTVHLHGRLTLGTGASWSGTDSNLSLPVTAIASTMVGSLYAYDSSATAYYTGMLHILSGTPTVASPFFFTNGGQGSRPGAGSTPFTWADGDLMRYNITYEAAS